MHQKADPELTERIWQEVMNDIIPDKNGPTLRRWETAIKDPAFDGIRDQILVLTTADDFKAVLRAGTVSANVYLRRLQNHVMDMPALQPRFSVELQPEKLHLRDVGRLNGLDLQGLLDGRRIRGHHIGPKRGNREGQRRPVDKVGRPGGGVAVAGRRGGERKRR